MTFPRTIELSDLLRMTIEPAPFQRPVDVDHVRNIVEYAQTAISNGRTPVLNSIVVARLDDRGSSRTLVIDGQHRLEAIRRLREIGHPLPRIPCLEYVFSSMGEVRAAFVDLNTVYTVAEVYLDVVDPPSVYSAIEGYVLNLEKNQNGVKWKPFSSSRTVRPRGDATRFMDALRRTVVSQFRSLDDFIEFETRVNDDLRNKCSDAAFVKKNNIKGPMLAVWSTYDYFITCQLDYSWLTDFTHY